MHTSREILSVAKEEKDNVPLPAMIREIMELYDNYFPTKLFRPELKPSTLIEKIRLVTEKYGLIPASEETETLLQGIEMFWYNIKRESHLQELNRAIFYATVIGEQFDDDEVIVDEIVRIGMPGLPQPDGSMNSPVIIGGMKALVFYPPEEAKKNYKDGT